VSISYTRKLGGGDGLVADNPTMKQVNTGLLINTDHMLVEATLKLQLQSRRMVPSQPWHNVGKLKDGRVAEECANRRSGDLGGLCVLGDPEELWSAFKTTVLEVASPCLGNHRRAKKNFISQGTMDTID